MKWLRKKQNPSSSSSSLSVFPLSWATRFRQLRQNPTKEMQNQHSSLERETATKNVTFGVPRVKTAIKEDLSDHESHHKTHQRIRQAQKEETRSSVRMEGKVRVSSPRTPSRRETCKIRPLESMKRKKKAKERPSEEVTERVESFAVVKRSLDPERDFQDSMMEMIVEKGIKKPEEMEELLACYLTLNSDEYHDLIIKVFRQVWKELEMMRELNRRLKEMSMVFED